MNKYFYLSCVLFFVILLIYNLKGEQISIEGGAYRSPIYRPKKKELEKKENNNIYINIFFSLILGIIYIFMMKNGQQLIPIVDGTSGFDIIDDFPEDLDFEMID